MKKIILSSLISLAILAGCDDGDKTPAQNQAQSPKPAVSQVAKKTVKAPKGEEQAKAAEERYRDLTAKSLEHINVLLGSHKLFNISLLNIEYEKGENQSKAKTNLEIKLADSLEAKKLGLVIEDTLSHTDELADKGIIAQVNRVYKIDNASFADFDGLELVAPALNYLVETIDFEANGINKLETKIKNFENSSENFSAKYEGLTIKSQYEQKELGNPLLTYNSDIHSGSLQIGDKELTINVEPLDAKYNLGKSSNFETLNPLVIKGNGEVGNGELKIEKITNLGKNLDFDKELGIYLGENNFLAKNLSFNSNLLGEKSILIDNVLANSSISAKGEGFDYKIGFSIEPKTDLLNMFAQTPAELKINKVSFDFYLPNVSKELVALASEMQTKAPADIESYMKNNADKLTKVVASAIKANNLSSNLGARIDLASGYADLKLQTKLNGEVDFSNLEKAANEIMEKVELKGNLEFSEAIVVNSGMKEMFDAMAAALNPKLEKGVYKFYIEASKKGVSVNGAKVF